MTAESKSHRDRARPATMEAYLQWHKSETSREITEATRNLTDTNLRTMLNTANDHPFFQGIPDLLAAASQEYADSTHSRLLVTDTFDLTPKPFDSIVEKSYRLNVVWNNRWPKPPKWRTEDRGEWVTPDNWYRAFDDLIRATIVARYIDGPQFIGDRLEALARSCNLTSRIEPRALDVGYYAHHFYVELPVRLL